MEEKQADSSLDLSHLTEDEQTTILQVLQRDSELRRLDEGRVRNLQEKEKDPIRLRYLSGEWFREQCRKRHHTWSASALVHATIRHRKTKTRDVPLTGLFNGETEETSHNNNTLPEAEGRLKDSKDDESGGGEGSLTPTPTPRTKSPIAQKLPYGNSSSSTSSKELERRSNGHSEEPEVAEEGRHSYEKQQNSRMEDHFFKQH